MIILILLLFSVTSFAQEWVLGEGNQFNFAVGLQYDVEPGIVEEGVFGGLSNWVGTVEDFEITQNALTNFNYVTWTNYDTNGLPAELLGPILDSVVDYDGGFDSFGFSGFDPDFSLDPSENAHLDMPYLVGNGAAEFTEVGVFGDDPDANDIFTMDAWDWLFTGQNGEWENLPGIKYAISEGVNQLFNSIDYQFIRRFIGTACTSVCAIHMIWIGSVIASGIFRAVVAGITGVHTGGN